MSLSIHAAGAAVGGLVETGGIGGVWVHWKPQEKKDFTTEGTESTETETREMDLFTKTRAH